MVVVGEGKEGMGIENFFFLCDRLVIRIKDSWIKWNWNDRP